MSVQAYMFNLDIGLWSGLNRKMELAEAFQLPIVTVGDYHVVSGKARN
jgi:hypothetical protein